MKIAVVVFMILMVIGCATAAAEKGAQSRDDMVTNLLNELSTPSEPGIQYVVVDKHSVIYERSVLMTNRTSFNSRKNLSKLDMNFVAN